MVGVSNSEVAHREVVRVLLQVPATVLWPGVWRCEAPVHAVGTVDLCLTDRHGRRCSQSVPFEYRAEAAVVAKIRLVIYSKQQTAVRYHTAQYP